MPCFSMRTTSVTLENKEPATLSDALKAMGYEVRLVGQQINFTGYHAGKYASGSYINGTLKYEGSMDVAEVKQAYAAQIVEKTYSGYGWELTKQEDGSYVAEKQTGAW